MLLLILSFIKTWTLLTDKYPYNIMAANDEDDDNDDCDGGGCGDNSMGNSLDKRGMTSLRSK